MTVDNDLLNQAYNLWASFKEEILYRNRFQVKHTVLDYLEKIAENSKAIINKNTILYRARIFSENRSYLPIRKVDYDSFDNKQLEQLKSLKESYEKFKEQTKFLGYNEQNSFVPTDNNIVGEGRANPSLIKYLYTAESAYTALTEVRPYLGATVSVAEIVVTDELVIADFSFQALKEIKSFEQNLMFNIMYDFSLPINNDTKGYIPTQYIAEFLKNLGYDGIKFNSSLHQYGCNITIFNYDKCKAISSKLYKIKDICIESECIKPENEIGLIHPKLQENKKLEFFNLLSNLPKKDNSPKD